MRRAVGPFAVFALAALVTGSEAADLPSFRVPDGIGRAHV